MSSSLNLTDIDETDMGKPVLLGQLLDTFVAATNHYPESIIITEDQAKRYFFANNEIMPDFRGIPLKVWQNTQEIPTVVRTIDSILKGMHSRRVKDVADVYENLESMKERVSRIHHV